MPHRPRGRRPGAPHEECHQAYRGYTEATDPAEAEFWAESWMAIGCESDEIEHRVRGLLAELHVFQGSP